MRRILAATLLFPLSLIHAQAPAPQPRFAILGVDGLSVEGVRNTRSPHLHAFMERAAWSLEARAVMPTLSSPNWESIITGAAPEQHGITSNGYLKERIELKPVCIDAQGKFPTIFQVLRDQRPASRIAVFHDWDDFAGLLEATAPDVLQHVSGARRTADAALRYWNESHPELLFVHLDNVDHAGHEYGWSTREYYAAVEDADAYLGKLLDALLATPDTYVLITSDHGGKGRGHGGNTMGEIEIPWILTGPGVATGRIAAPINTFDTAATVAWVFGLTTPACWIGRPALAAFTPDAAAARATRPASNAAAANCAAEPPSPSPVGPLAFHDMQAKGHQ
jgi:predicted AlkP superfamily pyrophosphatase or phosphodiesterase